MICTTKGMTTMKLMKTSDAELKHLSILVHGDTGSGKTTSILTLPEKSTLVLCAERGVIPLRKKNYHLLQIESWDDIQKAYRWLSGKGAGWSDDELKVVRECRTVVIDSLSELSNLLTRHIIGDLRPNVLKSRTGKETPDKVYEELMQMEDWGVYRKKILDLVSAFCHLPKHIIFTSLSGWHKDKTSNDTLRVPNLSGKAALEVGAFFDCVLHMAADPTDATARRWRTAGDGMILAKDSSGVLNEFEETDWAKLILKIVGTKEKKNGAE